MPRGGPRPGSGRKPGSPNQRTRKVAAAAAAAGQTPVEYMLEVMRNPKAPAAQRLEAAKAAAPYVHPRLSAVQVSLADMTDEELQDLAR